MLTEEEISHIAHLARLALTAEEKTRFGAQLSRILGYMDILKEVDVEKVQETSQVTGLANVMDEDIMHLSQTTPDELLAQSELPIDSHQIRVMRIIK